jgi:hypothetical protein
MLGVNRTSLGITMSVDVSVVTIIGCEVTGKLYKITYETSVTKNKQPGCDHDSDTGPYCKQCGSPVNKTEKVTKCVLQLTKYDKGIIGTPFAVFDHRFYLNDEGVEFIGVKVAKMDADGCGHIIEKVKLDNLESIRKELQEFLTPLDLWDPDSFGVWNILAYS